LIWGIYVIYLDFAIAIQKYSNHHNWRKWANTSYISDMVAWL